MRRDVVLGLQIVRYGVRTALAELIVVVGIADGVGSTGDVRECSRGAGKVRGKVVELLLVGGGQDILVEGEGYADIGELLVVVEIGDDTAEAVDTVVGLLRGLVCRVGRLTGRESVLIGSVCRGLGVGDAALARSSVSTM